MRFLILFLILCGIFDYLDGKNYIPIKIDKSPFIDGNLNEDCWGKIKKFSFVLKNREIPKMATFGRIYYDKENLYIGIECYENQIEKLHKRFTNYDDPIWADDCIEIFIAPDYFNKNNYYHFVVNCIGTKFDQKVDLSGFNSLWNGQWEAKTKIENDKWTAEIKIPFETIGIKNIEKINLIGMSLCRERKTEIENSSWEIGGWFHNPEGHLLFKNYKEYFRKDVLPIWEKEKIEIKKMLRMYMIKNNLKEKIEEICKIVEKNIKCLSKKKELTTEEINGFIEILKSSLNSIKSLKEELKFLYHMKKLEKIIKGIKGE